MPRAITLLTAATFAAAVFAAAAQTSMKPSAPQKMTSPAEAQKLRDCEKRAAADNVRMEERAKYLMDCLTGKPK